MHSKTIHTGGCIVISGTAVSNDSDRRCLIDCAGLLRPASLKARECVDRGDAKPDLGSMPMAPSPYNVDIGTLLGIGPVSKPPMLSGRS